MGVCKKRQNTHVKYKRFSSGISDLMFSRNFFVCSSTSCVVYRKVESWKMRVNYEEGWSRRCRYLIKFRRLLRLLEFLHDAYYVMGRSGRESFKWTGAKLELSKRDSTVIWRAPPWQRKLYNWTGISPSFKSEAVESKKFQFLHLSKPICGKANGIQTILRKKTRNMLGYWKAQVRYDKTEIESGFWGEINISQIPIYQRLSQGRSQTVLPGQAQKNQDRLKA